MDYIAPQSFTDGERLSAHKLRILASNDEHFNGECEYLEMAHRFARQGPINGGERTWCMYDGYIWLTSDTVTVYCTYTDGVAPSPSGTIYFDYGGAHQISQVLSSVGDQNFTFDVSNETNYPKNALYRIYYQLLWDGDSGPPTGSIYQIYTQYTDTLSYTPPTSMTDGLLSGAGHLNALRDNDLYFRAIESDNHPCMVRAGGSIVAWSGRVKHAEAKRRIYYHVKHYLSCGDHMYIKYGGTTYVDITDGAEHESYFDVPASTFVEGTWYTVGAVGSTLGMGGDVYYFERGPTAKHAGFTSLGVFMPGQPGWGDTANIRARLDLLADNDVNINSRLSQYNYPVQTCYDPNGSMKFALAFRRRRNVLYYKGIGITMHWGDNNSQQLVDCDGSHTYRTLDLSSISTLTIGQVYYLDTDWVGTNSLSFAVERNS